MHIKPTATVRLAVPRISPQLDEWDGDLVEPALDMRGFHVADIDLFEVKSLLLDDCELERGSLVGVKLDKVEITDARLKSVEAAGLRTYKAEFLRVTFNNCRFTGADFPEATFEDCTFKNVKFDEAGFRFASFKRVRFEDCMLARTDFSSAKLQHVAFDDCGLEQTNFASATCTQVDLGHEDLSNCKGILGLKGATILDEQLIQIAPLLASELGFKTRSEA